MKLTWEEFKFVLQYNIMFEQTHCIQTTLIHSLYFSSPSPPSPPHPRHFSQVFIFIFFIYIQMRWSMQAHTIPIKSCGDAHLRIKGKQQM